MAENRSKYPETTIYIPGELWSEFSLWVDQQGLKLEELGDDPSVAYHFTLSRPEPVDDMPPKIGPWV